MILGQVQLGRFVHQLDRGSPITDSGRKGSRLLQLRQNRVGVGMGVAECMHTYLCIYIYIYIHTYICVYIYI